MMPDEITKKPKTRKAPAKRRLVNVTIVTQAGQTVLVQWHDGVARRAYIPADEVKAGKVAVDVLKAGIPYGAPWEEILTDILNSRDISPEAFAAALRGRGIWTVEDMERNPREARRAIDAAVGIHIGELCRMMRRTNRR